MSKIARIILMTILLVAISLMTSQFTLNHDVKAYPEWHEGELSITDIKPWHDMYLENNHVTMNLVITNHTNKTHTFWVLERIGSLSDRDVIKSLPNSTLYDYKQIGGNNSTSIMSFSQQIPTGSWYLYVQMTIDSTNGPQVDDKTEFFVVQPYSDYLLLLGMITSGIIGVATVIALFLTKYSADKQTSELRKQTQINEVKFRLLNRPWIGPSQHLKLEPRGLILSYSNYGPLPTTSTKAQFLISDSEITRMSLYTSPVLQTSELGTIMPTKKEELVMEITDQQITRANSGGEFYVGVSISYSHSGGVKGEYGVIYYYNNASESFVINEEWTDLNERHPIPRGLELEHDVHAGIMQTEREPTHLLNRVKTGEIVILDDNDERVFNPYVKQLVKIGLTLRNNQDRSQPFAYIVQVQDSEGITTRLNSITGVISPWQSLQPFIPWTPTTEGNFIIQFFVWESIETPRPLSHPLTIQLGVLPKKTRRWSRFFRIFKYFRRIPKKL